MIFRTSLIQFNYISFKFPSICCQGRFSNGSYLVWDVIPRNVLVDRITP